MSSMTSNFTCCVFCLTLKIRKRFKELTVMIDMVSFYLENVIFHIPNSSMKDGFISSESLEVDAICFMQLHA